MFKELSNIESSQYRQYHLCQWSLTFSNSGPNFKSWNFLRGTSDCIYAEAIWHLLIAFFSPKYNYLKSSNTLSNVTEFLHLKHHSVYLYLYINDLMVHLQYLWGQPGGHDPKVGNHWFTWNLIAVRVQPYIPVLVHKPMHRKKRMVSSGPQCYKPCDFNADKLSCPSLNYHLCYL